jgi:ribosome-binding factor A
MRIARHAKIYASLMEEHATWTGKMETLKQTKETLERFKSDRLRAVSDIARDVSAYLANMENEKE